MDTVEGPTVGKRISESARSVSALALLGLVVGDAAIPPNFDRRCCSIGPCVIASIVIARAELASSGAALGGGAGAVVGTTWAMVGLALGVLVEMVMAAIVGASVRGELEGAMLAMVGLIVIAVTVGAFVIAVGIFVAVVGPIVMGVFVVIDGTFVAAVGAMDVGALVGTFVAVVGLVVVGALVVIVGTFVPAFEAEVIVAFWRTALVWVNKPPIKLDCVSKVIEVLQRI